MTEDKEFDTEFDRITAGLDLDFSPTDVVDFSLTTDVDLSLRFSRTRQELLALRNEDGSTEMMKPTTETGRRLHSERAAILIEMRRRGLK